MNVVTETLLGANKNTISFNSNKKYRHADVLAWLDAAFQSALGLSLS